MTLFVAIIGTAIGGWLLAISAHLLKFDNRSYFRCCMAFLLFICFTVLYAKLFGGSNIVISFVTLYILFVITILLVLNAPIKKAMVAGIVFTVLLNITGAGIASLFLANTNSEVDPQMLNKIQK